jgi:hypothetical protein
METLEQRIQAKENKMLEKVITSPMGKETFDEFHHDMGYIYCVVDKDQNSVGRFHEFHDAVDKAGKWAKCYPNEAPFSIEKREKLWFSDRSIQVLLEAKRI